MHKNTKLVEQFDPEEFDLSLLDWTTSSSHPIIASSAVYLSDAQKTKISKLPPKRFKQPKLGLNRPRPINKYRTKIQERIFEENTITFVKWNGYKRAVSLTPITFLNKLAYNAYVEYEKGLSEVLTGRAHEHPDWNQEFQDQEIFVKDFNTIFKKIKKEKSELTPYQWDIEVPQGHVSPFKYEKVISNHRIKWDLYLEEMGELPVAPTHGYNPISHVDPKLKKKDLNALVKKAKQGGFDYIDLPYDSIERIPSMTPYPIPLSNFLQSLGIDHDISLKPQTYVSYGRDGRLDPRGKHLFYHVVSINIKSITKDQIIERLYSQNFEGGRKFTAEEVMACLYAALKEYDVILLDKLPVQGEYKHIEGSVVSFEGLLSKLNVSSNLEYQARKTYGCCYRALDKEMKGLGGHYAAVKKLASYFTRHSEHLSLKQIEHCVLKTRDIYSSTKPHRYEVQDAACKRIAREIYNSNSSKRTSIGCCNGSPIREIRKKQKNLDTSEFILLFTKLEYEIQNL